MIPGSVTVYDNEQAAGSGLARAIYDQLWSLNKDQLTAIDQAYYNVINTPDTPLEVKQQLNAQRIAARLGTLRGWAKTANEIGPPIVAYLQANAVVSLINVHATVDTGDSVGRLPAVLTPGDPIDGPAAPVDLPVTGAGAVTTLALQ